MASDNIVITSACRTPIGSFQGNLSNVTAPRLGSEVIRDSINKSHIEPSDINESIFGCVLPAGIGQVMCTMRKEMVKFLELQ